MASDGTRFIFNAGRTPAETFAVVGFTLKQSLSSLFRLDITVACNDPAIGFKQVLDEMATLTIWQGETLQRRVRGIVTFCEQGNTGKHQTLYTMTVHPEFWRSSQRQNCRSFQNYDIAYIFAKLLKEMDIRTHDTLFRRPHPEREFCVQFMETDYEFISRLAAEEGLFFFEEEYLKENAQKLTFADDSSVLRSLGSLPYNPNAASESSTYCINTFRRSAQIRPAQVTTQDYTFTAPNWPAQYNEYGRKLAYQRPEYEIFDYPGRFKDEQHGADFARYQVEGWRNNVDFASGTSNSPQLQPGRRFALTDHPREDLNDVWQVVSCVLTGSQPQALIGSSGQGTTLNCEFHVIPAIQTWRPQPLPKPLIDGPQIAIVTGPAGEEIYCDEHGRVTVKFAWDRYNKASEESSCWVRVSQAWAGTGFGNIAIPRVGQEVIVDFLNGDPDQPIITGRTYHAANRSPGDLPGTKTQMAIRSQTYKGNGYNELMFEDQTGQELLSMHAQKDMKTVVLNNRDTTVKVDHAETIGNNQSISVGLGQTVKVGKENVGGHDQKITVAHDRNITVHNDQTLKVTRDRTVNSGRDDNLYVERDRKVTVKGKQEHKTTGNHISLVDGKHSLEVKGDLARKVAGALGIHVDGDIVLESSSQISLKVGSSFIAIHPGGVDIMGMKINLNGGGSAGTPVQTLESTLQGEMSSNDNNTADNHKGSDDSGGGDGFGEQEPSKEKGIVENDTDIITTETMVAMPIDRSRKKIGVGEQVNLTCNNEVTAWSLLSIESGVLLKTGSHSASFTASDKTVKAMVTATTANGESSVQFIFVEPSAFVMKRVPGSPLLHHNGFPDCGWLGRPYVEPIDVNFYAIFIRERDSQATGTGPYGGLTGAWHGRYPTGASDWFGIVAQEYSPHLGNTLDSSIYDTIFATIGTHAGSETPFIACTLSMPILWEWTIDKTKIYSFPGTEQKHEIFTDGRCTTTKTVHHETTNYTDSDSGLKFMRR